MLTVSNTIISSTVQLQEYKAAPQASGNRILKPLKKWSVGTCLKYESLELFLFLPNYNIQSLNLIVGFDKISILMIY